MSGLRILHAIRSDGYSGVERFVLRLAAAQAAAGDAVTIIGGSPQRMRAALADSGIEHLPARRTLEVARLIRGRRRETDVVNTHMTAADLAALAAFGGRRHRPAVVSTRHFAQPRGRVGPVPIDRIVRGVIDADIAISRTVADAVRVPATVVSPGLPGRPAAQAPRDRVVLMAQRLQPEKRTEVGIRAFALSGLAAEGWRLRIAGDGPERTALTDAARSLGVEESVDFLGFRDDVLDLMDRSRLFLASCPMEHLGLSVLEAMRSGLPVVAAAAGGHVELLSGLDDRALFTPGDAQAAASRLRSLADDDGARRALGAAERARQAADFTLDRQRSATRAVYARALAGVRR